MSQTKKDHEYFMRIALKEAYKAFNREEVPVGAVIVEKEKIISRSHNQSLSQTDPTSHAEINVIRETSRKKGNYRLLGCHLYVTLEPCPMCVGALIQARISKLIFGSYDPKAGAVESVMNFPWEMMNHRPKIQGGVLEEECAKILREFFQNKRRT